VGRVVGDVRVRRRSRKEERARSVFFGANVTEIKIYFFGVIKLQGVKLPTKLL